MEALRDAVEALGFTEVGTVIASGNVIVSDPAERDTATVAAVLDAGLSAALGFPTVSAVRTADQLRVLDRAAHRVATDDPADGAVHVLFTMANPSTAIRPAAGSADPPDPLDGLCRPSDAFVRCGADVLWRRSGRFSDAPMDAKTIAAAVGAEYTARRHDTVAKVLDLM